MSVQSITARSQECDFDAFQINRSDTVTSELRRVKLDDLSTGEIVVRTAFAGVNYKDALATSDYGNVIRCFPRIGGSDGAGWVVASADPSFKEGDEVVVYGGGFGVDHDGAFSEYFRVLTDWVSKLPDNMTLLEAAALGIAGFTAALAVHLLEEAGIRPDLGKVFVNGATGAVPGMGIEMLSGLGFDISAATSKPDQAEYLRDLGANEVIGASWIDEGKPLERARWAAALDALGGQGLSHLLRSIMPRGCVASYGNVTGNDVTTSVLPFILRGIRLIGVNVTYYGDLRSVLWQRMADDLRPVRMLRDVQSIKIGALHEQITRMLNGHTVGRTVVAFSS